MTTFLISFLVIVVFMLALSLGVIMGRPPIRGSCGGVNNPEGCEFCSGKCSDREPGGSARAVRPDQP